ncbi:hypothetical protein NUSPORA_00605 [Nucleospora cyclopteri]
MALIQLFCHPFRMKKKMDLAVEAAMEFLIIDSSSDLCKSKENSENSSEINVIYSSEKEEYKNTRKKIKKTEKIAIKHIKDFNDLNLKKAIQENEKIVNEADKNTFYGANKINEGSKTFYEQVLLYFEPKNQVFKGIKNDTITRKKVINNDTNAKYKIIIRIDDEIITVYMNGNETTNTLYEHIFGENGEGKLLFEEMKLPKNLTADECGFFEGVNYIFAEGKTTFKKLQLKINRKDETVLEIEVKTEDKIESLLPDNRYCLIKNGLLLNPRLKIGDVFENEDTVDLVLINKLEINNC